MLKGDRLRKLRQMRGYTHAELAELLDLSVRQINRYESNQSDPAGDIVARIAEVFNVSSDYLLGLSNDPSPNLRVDNLTNRERRLLAALRRGEQIEAMKAILMDDEM